MYITVENAARCAQTRSFFFAELRILERKSSSASPQINQTLEMTKGETATKPAKSKKTL
jgi:hypothetical protein